MRRILRSRRAEQAGLSLVEMVVTVGLLGLLTAMIVPIVSVFLSTESSSTQRTDDTDALMIAMDHLTEDLRTALPTGTASGTQQPPLTDAEDNQLTLYANLGGTYGPSRVTVSLSSNCLPPTSATWPCTLTENDTSATSASAPSLPVYTGGLTTSVVTRNVDISKSPLFRYYALGGSTALTTPMKPPSTTTTIENVLLTLTVRASITAPASTATADVHLRNVDYADGVG